LTADIKKWEKHAEQAVAAGRDDLAEKALEEQAYDEERLKNLLPALASAKAQTAKMKVSVEKMKETIRQNEADSSVLIARAKAARALEGSAKAMSKISGGNPFDGIKSMEEKISAQENRAEAIEELTKSAQSTLEDEFKKISSSASVKEKLAAIKAKTEVKL
jgi:phage shock protein A